MITRAQIMKFAPGAKAELVDAIVRNWGAASAAKIDANPRRLHRFMASIGVETGGLKSISENLNYTSAQRIYDIFKGAPKKRRFANVAACQAYVRQPKKLAIKVYGGRLGNKPAPSEDGWVYRGAGMMQTTGYDGFAGLGFGDNPDALRDPDTAFLTAVREWTKRGCNALADKKNDPGVRKAINGGLNGYDEFLAYIAKAERVWPTATAAVANDDAVIEREYAPPANEPDVVEEEAPMPLPREDRPVTQATHSDEDTVRRVQAQLWDLGYTEVGSRDPKTGEFDGRNGILTKTAILAFRNENGLPVNDTIDDELLAALGTAPKRELAEKRTEATPAEVREQVPEVKASFLSRAWAWFLGGGAGALGIGMGAGDADPDKNGFLKQLAMKLLDVPGWAWCAVVVVIALAIVYLNNRGVKFGEQAYKDGSRR